MSHPVWLNEIMIDVSLSRSCSEDSLAFDDSTECPLWRLCESLADEFVRSCLDARDPFLVRRRMERQICATMDFEPVRASALFELALETLHLRCEGSYQSDLAEIAHLMAVVTGGDELFHQN